MLKIIVKVTPQVIQRIIAVESSNNKMGMTNVRAKINFDKNVATVDSQISLNECLFSDSSEK